MVDTPNLRMFVTRGATGRLFVVDMTQNVAITCFVSPKSIWESRQDAIKAAPTKPVGKDRIDTDGEAYL